MFSMLRTSEKSSRRVLFRFSLCSVARGMVKDILIDSCSSFVARSRSRLLAHSQSPNRPLGLWRRQSWDNQFTQFSISFTTQQDSFHVCLLTLFFCRETLFFVPAVANFATYWPDAWDMNETKRKGVGQAAPWIWEWDESTNGLEKMSNGYKALRFFDLCCLAPWITPTALHQRCTSVFLPNQFLLFVLFILNNCFFNRISIL